MHDKSFGGNVEEDARRLGLVPNERAGFCRCNSDRMLQPGTAFGRIVDKRWVIFCRRCVIDMIEIGH